MMKMSKWILVVAMMATNALASNKTVEFVVPYAPGGAADRFAQIIMPALRAEMAKENLLPVIVYKPGAGSVTGIASVAKNQQTQLVIASNSVITAPIINRLPNSYNVAEDLDIVSYLGHLPLIMVTSATSGISSFADVEQQCRSKKFNYASGGPGTASHLGSAVVFEKINCDAPHVPYKGLGPMIAALLGNHSPVGSDFVSSVKALIDDGKLKPLLVLDRNRIDSLPSVPSLADIGIADSKIDNWFVIMTNRAASSPAVNRAVAAAMASTEAVDKFRAAGLRDIAARKPKNFLVTEQQTLLRVLKATKIDE